MLAGIRSRLTYANVISTLCLFLLLGGGAYAAFELPTNSVKSRHIAPGQVRSGDVDLSGRKRLNDPTPGDGLGPSVTLFRGDGVKVIGICRDNASNVGGDDVANVQVLAEDGSISGIEANTGTEISSPAGSVGTMTVRANNGTDENVVNSAYFFAVKPDGNAVSGSVSAELNDTQSTFDCIFAATGIG